MVILGLMIATLVMSLFVSVGGKLYWLDFLYVASYIKMGVTPLKYIPQVRARVGGKMGQHDILWGASSLTHRGCVLLSCIYYGMLYYGPVLNYQTGIIANGTIIAVQCNFDRKQYPPGLVFQ